MVELPDKLPLVEYDFFLRSRYGETDKMGHVYHSRFLEYFEVARTEMIRSYGFLYSNMEEEGIMLPVIDANIEFKSPVYYDEEMIIKVLIFDSPSVRLHTYYQVNAKERNKLCVTGKVTLCFIDEQTRKPCKAPAYFLEYFNHSK